VLERRVRELEAQRDAAWERLTERDPRQPRMRRERVPPIPPIVPPQTRGPDQTRAQARRTRDAEDSPAER
jgi:hypothetical protein